MGKRKLTMLAALAVLAAAFVWFRAGRSGEAVSPAEPAGGGASAAEGPAATPPGAEAAREHVQPTLDDQSASRHAAESSETTIRGRVVDVQASPIEGALVRLLRRSSDEFPTLDRSVPVQELASASTMSDGRFSFAVDQDRTYRVEASASGRAPAMKGDVRAGDELELVLAVGATVFGGVTRSSDGSAVVDALVELRPRSRDDGPSFLAAPKRTRTDGAGTFLVDGLPSGPWGLEVFPSGEASSLRHELDLAPGQRARYDVVVDPGTIVRGRVTNAATGAGIEGAEVGEGWTFARPVKSGANGEYEFRGFSKLYVYLHARAPGFGTTERVVPDPAGGPVRVDLELVPSRRASGRVTDASGAPLEGVDVSAVASDHQGPKDSNRIDWRSARTDSRGEYALEELRADMRHSLLVRKDGFGAAVYAFPDDELERAVIRLPDVALGAASRLRGAVVDEHGVGFAHLEVALSGTNVDRFRFGEAQRDDSWSIDLYVAQRSTQTDSNGRFSFADVAAGSYEVRVRRPNSHESVHATRDVPPGATIDDVRFVLERGLELSGRVVVSDGRGVPKVYVSIDPRGAGVSADVECAPDGTFHAIGLSNTSYDLTAYPYVSPEETAAGRRLIATRLEDVAAGRTDVVIELTIAKVVRGRVTNSSGAPVGEALVVALLAGAPCAETTTNAQGAFELQLASDAEVELVVGKAASTPSLGYTVDELLSDPHAVRLRGVRAGGAELAIRLDPR